MGLLLALLIAGCAKRPHSERMPDAPVPVPEVPADADPAYARGAQLYRVASCVV